MLFTADLLVAGLGLLAPPVMDFVKKKFIKSEADTPERTMGTLATTTPEHMKTFAEGQAMLMEAKAKYFNRDVVGEISIYIRNLRAAIRPMGVIMCLGALIGDGFVDGFALQQGVRLSMELVVSNWFGSRMVLK